MSAVAPKIGRAFTSLFKQVNVSVFGPEMRIYGKVPSPRILGVEVSSIMPLTYRGMPTYLSVSALQTMGDKLGGRSRHEYFHRADDVPLSVPTDCHHVRFPAPIDEKMIGKIAAEMIETGALSEREGGRLREDFLKANPLGEVSMKERYKTLKEARALQGMDEKEGYIGKEPPADDEPPAVPTLRAGRVFTSISRRGGLFEVHVDGNIMDVHYLGGRGGISDLGARLGGKDDHRAYNREGVDCRVQCHRIELPEPIDEKMMEKIVGEMVEYAALWEDEGEKMLEEFKKEGPQTSYRTVKSLKATLKEMEPKPPTEDEEFHGGPSRLR